jgi:hypothetical protein
MDGQKLAAAAIGLGRSAQVSGANVIEALNAKLIEVIRERDMLKNPLTMPDLRPV